MGELDLLISNGNVVIPYQGIRKLDVGVKNGKIAYLGTGLNPSPNQHLDAEGRHVLPGVIDAHSHYGVYSPFEKDFYITSREAAIGGVTSVVNFSRGPKSYLEVIPDEIQKASANSVIDFTFHLGILTNEQLQQIPSYVREIKITSFKLYLGYKGMEHSRFGTDRILDDGLLVDILEQLQPLGSEVVLAIHCENMDVVYRLFEKYKDIVPNDTLQSFEKLSPDYVETESVLRCAFLAKKYGVKMVVVHMSAGMSVAAIQQVPWFDRNLIHIETCPHYLVETVDCAQGIRAIVKPPIRTKNDSDMLWKGIRAGVITTIGTDNCSVYDEVKFEKGRDIWNSKVGFGEVGFMLPLMLSEGYHARGISLTTIAEITSANTSKIYNMYPRKGSIEIGSDADLVMVDLGEERIIHNANFMRNSDFTIYEGRKVKGWPVMTIRRGEVIAQNGAIQDGVSAGEFLPRSVSR